MQEISVLVILLLIVYTVIAVTDQISIQCGIYTPLLRQPLRGFYWGI